MGKQSGLGDQLYIDGYNLSGDIGSIGRISGGHSPLEVTGIDKSAFERLGGMRDGGLEFNSWFNPTAGQAHDVLNDLPQGDRVALYLRGSGIGNAAAGLVGKQATYDPTRPADGSLSMAVSIPANGFGLNWGEQVTPGIRTDGAAANGAALDGLAQTTFGGQAFLQVFAVTGTSVTVKLQDSADNVTFADLAGASFVAVNGSARGGQRIAFTGTVRRYVRAVTVGVFTNAQFAAMFVRNPVAVTF